MAETMEKDGGGQRWYALLTSCRGGEDVAVRRRPRGSFVELRRPWWFLFPLLSLTACQVSVLLVEIGNRFLVAE